MSLSIIVAMAENGVIGDSNEREGMLWHVPEDLAHFKAITWGHPIIMGRKTYENIGRPLAGRTNIIVTRQSDFTAPGCTVVNSIEAAVELTKDDQEAFVIGGGELFAQTLHLVSKMYITEISANITGNVTFAFDDSDWMEISREFHAADDRNEYDYAFLTYERKAQS